MMPAPMIDLIMMVIVSMKSTSEGGLLALLAGMKLEIMEP